jgi:hypothetical protein
MGEHDKCIHLVEKRQERRLLKRYMRELEDNILIGIMCEGVK